MSEVIQIPKYLKGQNDYTMTRFCLGQGAFCVVVLGLMSVEGEDPKRVAIKIVNKTKTLTNSTRITALRDEVKILSTLDHPSITNLIEAIEDEENIYMVFEEYSGTLEDLMESRGEMTVNQMKCIFKQIFEAVAYCHKKGIAHRDIKPENIFYRIECNEVKVYLGDFGFATFYKPNELQTKYCGSLYYVSPEIVNHTPYSAAATDVWSLGSLLFYMLCGYCAFAGSKMKRVFKNIAKGKMQEFTEEIDGSTRLFILRMLTVEPEMRISLTQLEKHAWFRSFPTASSA
eukprot:TRINITY_DN26510_c0_g1_i1.p1 TRINITY_DN26510_c0_g1~~TRINITY_DN26510_c0_g1_i1.p1  ORF type:complete len:287 (+),score=73.73 TRINITY_DN26510_c0_g1_i1:87-947(+)